MWSWKKCSKDQKTKRNLVSRIRPAASACQINQRALVRTVHKQQSDKSGSTHAVNVLINNDRQGRRLKLFVSWIAINLCPYAEQRKHLSSEHPFLQPTYPPAVNGTLWALSDDRWISQLFPSSRDFFFHKSTYSNIDDDYLEKYNNGG